MLILQPNAPFSFHTPPGWPPSVWTAASRVSLVWHVCSRSISWRLGCKASRTRTDSTAQWWTASLSPFEARDFEACTAEAAWTYCWSHRRKRSNWQRTTICGTCWPTRTAASACLGRWWAVLEPVSVRSSSPHRWNCSRSRCKCSLRHHQVNRIRQFDPFRSLWSWVEHDLTD